MIFQVPLFGVPKSRWYCTPDTSTVPGKRMADTSNPEDTPSWNPQNKPLTCALSLLFSHALSVLSHRVLNQQTRVCPLSKRLQFKMRIPTNTYDFKRVNWSLSAVRLVACVCFRFFGLGPFFPSSSLALPLSHAVQKFFAFRWGLCLGKCPARMLSWKLRILTPTTCFTLLLLGCSHRRKRQAYAGLPQHCLNRFSLSRSLFRSLSPPYFFF